MSTREWDYIIVGGGTAGAVVAARLSEDHTARVLLLEAGGEYPAALSVPLPGMRYAAGYSWKYLTRQQAGLGYRRISLPFGKVVGGSSSVNAMMYYRGTPSCYDRWAFDGNSDWTFSRVLPYFRKSENQEHGSSPYHGIAGPVDVSDPRHRAPFSEAFVEACVETGLPYREDFNGPARHGAGFFQVTQRHGRRVSTADAYLKPARRRSGVRVETRALVTRLLRGRVRVNGVAFIDQAGETRAAYAAREVILSAGALNTPKILLLSGIGPAAELRSLGIEIVLDLPGVGRNLQDHVRVPVLYESSRSSPGDMAFWIPAALEYAVRRTGVMASNCCESGAVLCSTGDAGDPDLQFVTHFQSPLYAGTVDLQFCLLRTRSRGRITLASTDPAAPPWIDPNYLSDDEDVKLAVRGLRWARRIAQSPALRRFGLRAEVLPGSDLRTDDELEHHIRATAETCYHPVGTCRMGSDGLSVVDADLRVRGIEGLRVIDASIMPVLPDGNTCASTLMIAEKASDRVKGAPRI